MEPDKWNVKGRIVKMTKITPSDVTVLKYDALWVFGGGNLQFQPKENSAVLPDVLPVADNTILPVGILRVFATLTTATAIYGCEIRAE